MHMLHIGRSTVLVCGRHEDQGRGQYVLGSANWLSWDRASSTLWASFLNFPLSKLFPMVGPQTWMPYVSTRLTTTMVANAMVNQSVQQDEEAAEDQEGEKDDQQGEEEGKEHNK